MNWYQVSQINMGLLIKGQKPLQAYKPRDFDQPFDEIVEYMQKSSDWSVEDLYGQFPPMELDGAVNAVSSLNGSANNDWAGLLRKKHEQWEMGYKLQRKGKDLQDGKEPDVLDIATELQALARNETTGLRNAKDIDLTEVQEIMPSGWKLYDQCFGGMPTTGLIVVYAPTGTGKTFWTAKFSKEFLSHYENKKVAVYTLELTEGRYLKRSMNMYPELEQFVEDGRIFISGKAKGVENIVAETAINPPDLLIIDSIDYLYSAHGGEASASRADMIWKQLVMVGRLLEIPIIVVAQPNREWKHRAKTEFLSKYAIEWSGAAENAADQLIALQYVQEDMQMDDKTFPAMSDSYYMINWKQRGGYPISPSNPKGTGGAIILNKHNKRNGQRILWDSEAHGQSVNGEIIPIIWKPSNYVRKGNL